MCKTLHIQAKADAHDQATILFMIDQLCEMGGAERILIKTLQSLPSRFRPLVVTFKMDERLGIRDMAPCPIHVLPLTKTYTFGALRVAGQIRTMIRRENVRLVHTFFETSDLWGGLIARMLGVPVISSRRDMGILRSKKHRIAYRVLRRQFDMVLTVSEQVRRLCIEQDGVPSDRVHTHYNGLALENYEARRSRELVRQDFGVPIGAQVITCVGHLRHVKGIDVLVETARLVCERVPSAHFVCVGEDHAPEYVKSVRQRIAELNLGERIHLAGGYEDIPSALAASDIFYLPSRSEGFSNALIEAMACRLPCVATDVGGNREALEDGTNGFIIPPENPDAAASALCRLLTDPERAREMGARGRSIVERKFTASAMIWNLAAHYDYLLARRRYA